MRIQASGTVLATVFASCLHEDFPRWIGADPMWRASGIACQRHGTTLKGFLPRAWDHLVASDGTTRRVGSVCPFTRGLSILHPFGCPADSCNSFTLHAKIRPRRFVELVASLSRCIYSCLPPISSCQLPLCKANQMPDRLVPGARRLDRLGIAHQQDRFPCPGPARPQRC